MTTADLLITTGPEMLPWWLRDIVDAPSDPLPSPQPIVAPLPAGIWVPVPGVPGPRGAGAYWYDATSSDGFTYTASDPWGDALPVGVGFVGRVLVNMLPVPRTSYTAQGHGVIFTARLDPQDLVTFVFKESP